MSHFYRPGASPAPASQSEVQPQERDRIAQLIGANKSGPALDIAKDIHKRCRTAASEALLLDVYGARMTSLMDRNLDREAAALMDLVRERYPSAHDRLRDWNAAFAARHGDLSGLLAGLNDASLPAEKRTAIAAGVRRDVTDLRALADCPVLAADHPLRNAAAALQKAFVAVTTGPVPEEGLALPEVSRSSPLAPWKMLVRAIAAFYRRDDAHCERCVAAIEPDSAPARLAPALRVMMRAKAGGLEKLTPATTTLMNRTGGGDSLRIALKNLDTAFDRHNHHLILQETKNAVEVCRHSDPGLLDRLKQHLAVRSMAEGLKPDKVLAALGSSSLKNAHFWRLLARSLEDENGEPIAIGAACSCWEEFRKHAVREGWFPAVGPEVATVYLHMAELLRSLGDALPEVVNSFHRHFDYHAGYYNGQPAEICALMPLPDQRNLFFLSRTDLLERASMADPCAENYQSWLQASDEISTADGDRVAKVWSEARPSDIPPLLRLMQSAEDRNALQKAFNFMERAERIDGVNPEVRRARLRLLVSITIRHLRENKVKLAEKDLLQIQALPQAQQGDRPAFIAALRYAACRLRSGNRAAGAIYEEAMGFLGDGATTDLLFLHVAQKYTNAYPDIDKSKKPTVPLFAAFGRVCTICDDMGTIIDMPQQMVEPLARELRAPNVSGDPRYLAALGEAAMRRDYFPLAYLIAGVGMAQGPDNHARFLFLRARAMPPWESKRSSSCMEAASELARRHHDPELLRRIGEWRKNGVGMLGVPDQARSAMDSGEITSLIEREIREPLPDQVPQEMLDDEGEDQCQCPACCAERGEMPPGLLDMIDEFGPEVVAKALADIAGGGKKKHRRKGRANDFDLPF